MMSESMVERVARAIYAHEHRDGARPEPDVEPPWSVYAGTARAAIEAMREPSDDFLSFIAHAHDLRPQDWTEIIDAALTPSPASK